MTEDERHGPHGRGRRGPHGLREYRLVVRSRLALVRRPERLLARWRRRPVLQLADRYLGGLQGVEIGGAAHNDFRVDALNVDRYDGMDTVYKEAERKVWGWAKPVDLVAPGHDLPLPDKSTDFVLASHVLEHVPDPIAGLREWVRVARRYLFIVNPHRDRTFDRDRELTTLEELVERHATGFAPDEDRHWNVWTCERFLELCAYLGLEVLETRDPDTKGGNGFLVILSADVDPAELGGGDLRRLTEPSPS